MKAEIDDDLEREARTIDDATHVQIPRPSGQRIILDLPFSAIFKVLGVLLALYILGMVWPVILWLVVSLMLAAALAPFLALLERLHIPRILAIILVAVSVVAACGLVLWLVLPGFVQQTQYLIHHSHQYLSRLDGFLGQHGVHTNIRHYSGALSSRLNRALSELVLPALQQVYMASVAIFSIFFITIYMLTGHERLTAFFVGMLPVNRRDEALVVLREMRQQVSGYVLGQFIRSVTVGVFTFILMMVLGIPNPIALAIFAGLADLIPMFGGFLAGLPAALVALTISPAKSLVVIGAFVAYLFFEDHILIPNVHSRTNSVSPLVALVSVIVGAYLLGFIGILIALPIAAALPSLLRFFGIELDFDAVQRSADAMRGGTKGADPPITDSRAQRGDGTTHGQS